MHKSHRSIAIVSLFALLGGGAIIGCSEKTDMSKQEEQSFKGTGVIPPDAAAAIAKQREAAQSKAGPSGGAPAESVPTVPK